MNLGYSGKSNPVLGIIVELYLVHLIALLSTS